MPAAHSFHSATGWSETILHEAAHWSGAKHRLNRDLRNAFGSPDYSREEIRCEIAMSMICSELGMSCDFPNMAAYLASWIGTLKSDRHEIFRAAADAQRIANYLLAFHPDYAAAGGKAASSSDGEIEPAEQAPALVEAA